MPTLNERFKQLAQEAGIDWADEAARAVAVEALKAEVNPLYMAINNLGFGAGQAKMEKQVTDAVTAKTAAETRATQAEADRKAALDKAPDVATVNAQWETRLRETEDKHRLELEKVTGKTRTALTQRDQKELENELVALHVPRAMAKVMAKDPELLTRFDYGEDGSLSVRQAGQQIPLAPASGQTHLGLVAKELAATVETELLLSEADAGSGVNGGAGPGRGDQQSAFFKGIADKAKAEQAAEAPRVSLAERVKGR